MNARRVHELMCRWFPPIDRAALEWRVVLEGDGNMNADGLSSLIAEHVPSPDVLVHVHRRLGAAMAAADAPAFLREHIGGGDIRITDRRFRGFVVVSVNGVAAGWHRAGYPSRRARAMRAEDVAAQVEEALLSAQPNWAACHSDDPTERGIWASAQLQRFREEQARPPQRGVVQVEAVHAERCTGSDGECAVWFITRGEPLSVFFDESAQLFGAAWGPDARTGNCADLGFRGADPLNLFTA